MKNNRSMEHAILLFDGECNVCNYAVQFIIPRDPHAYFQFAASQSPIGQRLLVQHHLPRISVNSVILIRDEKVFGRSAAALQIVKRLSGLWPLLYIFIAVPKPVRDRLYVYFANNRYRWFGKREQCMIPSPKIKDRFL